MSCRLSANKEISLKSPRAYKVAVVVQRYGEEIIGGAESHARTLAEGLHSRLGYDVSVLTSTAMDHHSWENVYPEGESELNGVRIFRFRSEKKHRWLFRISTILFRFY